MQRMTTLPSAALVALVNGALLAGLAISWFVPPPRTSGPGWLKCQLHAHADAGVGVMEALGEYARLGYDAVAVCNHNGFAAAPSFPGLVVISACEHQGKQLHVLELRGDRKSVV